MNEFLILLQAKLDEAKSKGNVNADIDKIQSQINKLKIQAEIDPKTISNLVKQLENVLNQKINISNIGIDNSSAIKSAQQAGQQIGNVINQNVSSVIGKSSTLLKPFSELKIGTGNIDAIFNKNGLLDVEESLNRIKQTYSEFGQVRITNKIFDADGKLQQLKVNIQQVNGDLKETRSFMMELADNGKSFCFPQDVIKGSESYVQHLNETKNITNATGEAINVQKERLIEQEKYYSRIKNDVNLLYNLKQKLLSADKLETDELEKQIKSTKQRITYNNQQIDKKDLRDNSLDRQINDLEVAKQKQLALSDARIQDVANTKSQASAQKEINTALKEQQSLRSQTNKIQLSIDTGGYEAKVDSLVAKTRQWTDENGNARISTSALSTALGNLNTASVALSNNNTVANQQALIAAEKELDTQIKSVTNSIRSMNSEFAKDSSISSLHYKIQDFYDKNSASHGMFGSDLKRMLAETASGVKLTHAELQKITADFNNVSIAARQAGKLGKSWFQTIKEGSKSFSYWTSSTFIVMRAIRAFKSMVSNSHELDDALTNISYTMDMTNSQLEKIGNSSLKMAKDLNTSASNVLSAVKLYANAKETADTILKKAQPAIMISNVTGMTGEDAAKMLQAIMNQFDMTQDDLMNIADIIEVISQNMAYDFASGINEIAAGIGQSGSVAKNAGLNLQEYASMLGLVIEKTGQGGSTIGNAYKTIFQRITKASTTEGTLEEDISAAEKSLRAVGVEVRDTADNFRDLTDIMSDLGKVWNNLNSVEQSNISYNVAGVRQTNILKSLLGYWEDYENLVEKANDSSGTTLKNQEIYAKSLSGKLGKLSVIWEKIGDETLDSSVLKGFTDIGISISSLIEKVGLLKTAIGSIAFVSMIKNVGRIKNAYPQLSVPTI